MRVCGRIWEFRVRCLLAHSALCPLPTGPQVEKVPPAPCQQSQGREFCQAVWCDSQPLCHFSETSLTPPPMPLGRTRLIARPSEVGERVPSVSRGQVTHRSAPMEQGCVCVTGWQVRELLTRACGGPWRQVSRLPLVSSQPSTHKYLSWESKGYLRSPLRIQLASGVA